MKKSFYLTLVLCLYIIFYITGCGQSWESKIEISTLKIDDDYIVGKIKNKTDKYYKATLNFELKNGGLTEEIICYEDLKPNKIKNLDCLTYGFDNSYTVEIENVILEEQTIPELKNGNIDSETLKYYFEDIYDKHSLNLISLIHDIDDAKYPYIDKITYSDLEDEITISYTFFYKNSPILFNDEYNTKNNQVKRMYAIMINDDEVILSEIISRFSLMHPFIENKSLYVSNSLKQIFNDKNQEKGKCLRIDSWCAFATYDDATVTLGVEKH